MQHRATWAVLIAGALLAAGAPPAVASTSSDVFFTQPFAGTTAFRAAAAPGDAVFQFAAERVAVAEGVVTTITVLRSGDRTTAQAVGFTTQPGTASGGAAGSGADYVTKTGTLEFDQGEVAKRLTVDTNSDPSYEPTENFVVALRMPTGDATLGEWKDLTVSILDLQPPPTQTVTQTVTTTTPAPPAQTVTTTVATPAPPAETVTTTTPAPPAQTVTQTTPGPTVTKTVTVTGETPPPADTVAPRVGLTVADTITPAGLKKGSLGVTLSCSEICSFSGRIVGSGRPKGTLATFKGRRTSTTGQLVIKVRFSVKGRKLLRGTLRGTLTTTVVATDAAGNKGRATRKTTVAAPPAPDNSGVTGGGSG